MHCISKWIIQCAISVFTISDCQTTKYIPQYLFITNVRPLSSYLSGVNWLYLHNVIIPLVCVTHFVLPLSFYIQVQTTERSDWLECDEGAGLMSLLQDISTSNRYEFCDSSA